MAASGSVSQETSQEGANGEYTAEVAHEQAVKDTQDGETEEVLKRAKDEIAVAFLLEMTEEVLERVKQAGKRENVTVEVLERVKQEIMETVQPEEVITVVLKQVKEAGKLEGITEEVLELCIKQEITEAVQLDEITENILELVKLASKQEEITEEVLERIKQETKDAQLEEITEEVSKEETKDDEGSEEEATDESSKDKTKDEGFEEETTEEVLELVKRKIKEVVIVKIMEEILERAREACKSEEMGQEEAMERVKQEITQAVQLEELIAAIFESIEQELLVTGEIEELIHATLEGVKQAGKLDEITEEVLERVKKEITEKVAEEEIQEEGLGEEEITEEGAAEEEITEEGAAEEEITEEVAAEVEITKEGPAEEVITEEGFHDEPTKEDIETGKTHMDPEVYRWATTFPSKDISLYTVEKHIQIGTHKLRSPLGNTVLHLAASVGHLELVQPILKHCPSLLKEKNSNGDLPLHLAAYAGHLSVVGFLLDEDDDNKTSILNIPNKRGNTAMHVALENHHTKVAEFLANKDAGGSGANLPNGYKKTPLCMAAEAGNLDVVELMLSKSVSILHDSSVMRAAIIGSSPDVLEKILGRVDVALLKSTDEEWMTPLTLAAYIGNLNAVRSLLDKSPSLAYQCDQNSFIPIHVASKRGHIKIVEEFLHRCPDSKELLDGDERNILHVAAAHGRAKMVIYMLKTPELQVLINERDKTGNSPLHIAVKNWHPRIVRILTLDKRVNLNNLNNAGMTALDVADESKVDKEAMLRRQLTFMALKLAHAPRCEETRSAKSKLVLEDSDLVTETGITLPRQKTKDSSDDLLFASRENVKTLVLVSTLVATITFAAGFAMPGGYNNSGNDKEGMETLVSNWPFQIFLICNTIATYSSITVTLALIWAQIGDLNDLNMIYAAMRFVLPMLSLSLMMMSIGFLARVALVAKNRIWLFSLVLAIGSIFIIIILLLIVPLAAPVSSRNCVTRFILLANFSLLMTVTRYDIHLDQRQTHDSKMDLIELKSIFSALTDGRRGVLSQIIMKLVQKIRGLLG